MNPQNYVVPLETVIIALLLVLSGRNRINMECFHLRDHIQKPITLRDLAVTWYFWRLMALTRHLIWDVQGGWQDILLTYMEWHPKKSRQTFRTAFLLCTKPLHSSLLITRILVRGECHFQNIRQFILFESHFFSAETQKKGDYCYLFLPDNYPDGKGDTSPIKAENNRQKMCWHRYHYSSKENNESGVDTPLTNTWNIWSS